MVFKEILRQRIKTASYAAEGCIEERTLISSCAGTKVTEAQPPNPQPQDQDTTRLEQQNPLKSRGSLVQEDLVLMPLTINGQSPRSSN